MRTKVQVASGIAVAATMFTALLGAAGSGALAEEAVPVIVSDKIQTQFITEPVVQAIPKAEPALVLPGEVDATADSDDTLAERVQAQPQSAELDPQLRCLAGAIYFEARGESLAGQLAVGRVVVQRASSGRFPGSYCGVVYQPSQFSFVRGRSMPAVSESSTAWQRAVAIARIADEGSWRSPAEGALFFHAARVSPGWRLTRLARVDNHVFYR